MNRSSAEIEQEVEASRAQLDRNVEALKEKMTPGQLLDEAMNSLGGAGQQVASRLFDQVKQNPMPLAVVGLGLAWLVASNKDGAAPAGGEPRSFSDGHGIGEAAGGEAAGGEAAGGAADGLKARAQDLTDKASDALSSARDQLASGSSSAKEAVSGVGDQAARLAQQARQGVQQTLQNEPLLLGVAGLAIGLALGAALPPTEAEDRLMGQMRDRVADKAKSAAQTGLEQASSAAQEAYKGAKSELQSGEGDLPEKLAAAVKTGVSRAQDEIKPH